MLFFMLLMLISMLKTILNSRLSKGSNNLDNKKSNLHLTNNTNKKNCLNLTKNKEKIKLSILFKILFMIQIHKYKESQLRI